MHVHRAQDFPGTQYFHRKGILAYTCLHRKNKSTLSSGGHAHRHLKAIILCGVCVSVHPQNPFQVLSLIPHRYADRDIFPIGHLTLIPKSRFQVQGSVRYFLMDSFCTGSPGKSQQAKRQAEGQDPDSDSHILSSGSYSFFQIQARQAFRLLQKEAPAPGRTRRLPDAPAHLIRRAVRICSLRRKIFFEATNASAE